VATTTIIISITTTNHDPKVRMHSKGDRDIVGREDSVYFQNSPQGLL
jgi:hypothetical protein